MKCVLLLPMRVPNNSRCGRVSSSFGTTQAFAKLRLTLTESGPITLI